MKLSKQVTAEFDDGRGLLIGPAVLMAVKFMLAQQGGQLPRTGDSS